MWQGTRTVPLPSRTHTYEALTSYVRRRRYYYYFSRIVRLSKIIVEEYRE